MDIANLGAPLLQGGLLDSISRFVGGSPETTRKTLDASLPTAMYAIADHGSTESGARGLLEGLRSGQAPQLDVGGLGRTLADPKASDQLMATSGGFLEKMMGGKLNGLLGGLTSFGGGSSSMTSKLLALAAPLALGVIGKHAKSENLDAHGLAGFLGEQKDRVASLVPGPLRGFLGLAPPAAKVEPLHPAPVLAAAAPVIAAPVVAAPIVSREVERPRIAPAHAAPRHGARWPWYLFGLVVLLGLGLLLGRAFRSPQPKIAAAPTVQQPTPPPAPTPPPKAIEPPAAPAAEPAAPNAPEAQAPKAVAPAIAAGPLKPIATYLASDDTAPHRFVIQDLTFATGESTLTTEGQKSAEELATILKAHPDARIRIEGFTDSTGSADANRQLSQARADEVKRALADNGVDGTHVQATGMGQEQPTGPNGTSSGRGQNRRVEVLISKG